MANTYGVNPLVFDTAPYTTGTVSITLGSETVTGSGTVWTTTTHPTSQTALNRDRVTEISVNAGVTWYVVKSRDSDTQLTLETPFATADVTGASYLTRVRIIPRVKINSIVWTNPTASDEFILRDKAHAVVARLRAGSVEQETLQFSSPHWVDGLNFTALPSGVVDVYYE